MSLFWNEWFGLAAFGAARRLRPAGEMAEAAENETGRPGVLGWSRDGRLDDVPGAAGAEPRDPDEDRLFATFMSCPWM